MRPCLKIPAAAAAAVTYNENKRFNSKNRQMERLHGAMNRGRGVRAWSFLALCRTATLQNLSVFSETETPGFERHKKGSQDTMRC